MKARGHDALVLAGGQGVFFKKLALKKVPFEALKNLVHPVSPLKDLAAFFELRRVLKRVRPALVATHSNKAGFLGRLVAFSLKIPAVHTSHGFLFMDKPSSVRGLFYRFMEMVAAKLGQMVICVSQGEFDMAAALKVIPENKMAVVRNGLNDLEVAFRAKPEEEPVRLVMVARFAAPKDQATLLKALSDLKEFAFSLQFIGDGAGLNEAKALARDLGLAEKTEFLGERGDVEDLLAKASIFVLSSKREGFPISILEAMRAGLPVVASDVGGVSEAVIEEETGFLFAPGDALSLRTHLKELFLNPTLRQRLGQAGRKRFLEQFSLEKQVEETCEAYQQMLKRAL